MFLMFRLRWATVLFIFPLCIHSQIKTPLTTHNYELDSRYNQELTFLKNQEKKDPKNTLKSIAELSYYYKDWDTAIAYYERLLLSSPTAENHFKIGVAAARKSLEVSQFFSIPYAVKAIKYVKKAHELEPKRVIFLNLLIQLYAGIPTFLGGSNLYAEKKINELMAIDPFEGMMMQAHLFDVKNDYVAAKSKYMEGFSYLKNQFSDPRKWISKLNRDMFFVLGRSAAEYNIEAETAGVLLDHYINTFDFLDNYPLEWAYYYRSKIYFYNDRLEEAQRSIRKALETNPAFKEGEELLKTMKFE